MTDDHELDLNELKNMLENPKVAGVYVKILNKKNPDFFNDDDLAQNTRSNKHQQTDKLKENTNLKLKKRLKLQEEFKKHDQSTLITTTTSEPTTKLLQKLTTINSNLTSLKESNLFKKSNLNEAHLVTRTSASSSTTRRTYPTYTTRLFSKYTNKAPVNFGNVNSKNSSVTRESSKQILERFLKAKNVTPVNNN